MAETYLLLNPSFEISQTSTYYRCSALKKQSRYHLVKRATARVPATRRHWLGLKSVPYLVMVIGATGVAVWQRTSQGCLVSPGIATKRIHFSLSLHIVSISIYTEQGLSRWINRVWRFGDISLTFSLPAHRVACSHIATAKLRGFSLFSFFSHLLLVKDITRNFFGTTLRTMIQTNNVQSDVG